MKKYLLLFSALFVLAACNSGTNDSKDSTTKSTTTETGKNSSKKSTSTSEKADSTNDSSTKNSSTSSNTQTSSTKTDSSHGNHAMSAWDELKANYPNDKFPDPATISGGKQIGIAASEEQGTLKVNYYAVNGYTIQ